MKPNRLKVRHLLKLINKTFQTIFNIQVYKKCRGNKIMEPTITDFVVATRYIQ